MPYLQRKATKYGDKSLRALGPHLWNSLPQKIKSTTSILVFTDLIKTWFEPKCKCTPSTPLYTCTRTIFQRGEISDLIRC